MFLMFWQEIVEQLRPILEKMVGGAQCTHTHSYPQLVHTIFSNKCVHFLPLYTWESFHKWLPSSFSFFIPRPFSLDTFSLDPSYQPSYPYHFHFHQLSPVTVGSWAPFRFRSYWSCSLSSTKLSWYWIVCFYRMVPKFRVQNCPIKSAGLFWGF